MLEDSIQSLPSSDVSRSHHGLSRATEQAGQVEALVTAGLDVVGELDHHDARHGIAVLEGK